MSAMHNTPGPWRLEFRGGDWVVIGAGEIVVCKFPPIVDEIKDEQIANMNLVAALPVLVAALRAIKKVAEPNPGDANGGGWPYELAIAANHAAHQFAAAALKRAEGQS